MKILIVDDHPLFRAGFHAVLEQSTLDAGVLSVSSVTEALQTLQRDPDIGLVLLDIHLRGDDGFNALKVIGQKFPTTACIMISGDEQHRRRFARRLVRRLGLHPEILHRRRDDRRDPEGARRRRVRARHCRSVDARRIPTASRCGSSKSSACSGAASRTKRSRARSMSRSARSRRTSAPCSKRSMCVTARRQCWSRSVAASCPRRPPAFRPPARPRTHAR